MNKWQAEVIFHAPALNMSKSNFNKYVRCVMPGCGKTREKNSEVSFFSFPKDAAR